MQIDELDLLKKLYQKIIIPRTVYDELVVLDVQKELLDSTDWIEIQEIKNYELYFEIAELVDKGEAEAMVLALETKADFLLIDEQKGRLLAAEYGIKITGILGVLLLAKKAGYISEIRVYMERLRDIAGFHINPKLFAAIMKKTGEI